MVGDVRRRWRILRVLMYMRAPTRSTTRFQGQRNPLILSGTAATTKAPFSLITFCPGDATGSFPAWIHCRRQTAVFLLYEEYATKYNFDTSHSHGVYDQSPTQSVDLWCAADPSPDPPESGRMLCTSLDYFVVYPGSVANELLATVPVAKRVNTSHVNMFPLRHRHTSIHDLDAENRTASSASSSGHRSLPKTCPKEGVRLNVDAEGVITVNGTQVDLLDVSKYLRQLKPTPTLACYSLASTARKPLMAAISVTTDVALLDLPLEVFADSTFNTPVKLSKAVSDWRSWE